MGNVILLLREEIIKQNERIDKIEKHGYGIESSKVLTDYIDELYAAIEILLNHK